MFAIRLHKVPKGSDFRGKPLSLYWQFGGFGAAAPTGSAASMSSSSQLVQAMASFAAPNAIDSSNAAPFDSGTSQQVNLLTPGHA